MKISGIVQFEDMSAAGINLVREFQRNQSAVAITFTADLSTAIAEWESFNNLAHLTRLAAAVQVSDTKAAHGSDSARKTA